ncbi:hypothetical protein [Microcella frigidaquae]|uniref:Uncharacterized protein n=1 Tax=Microcella frigidaquae TaxID=424758 RepID=A0A840X658_9MICO|nr:hypothetical protein [Microcella frigidaquae]MBB5618023.1 hypothetical protein [Microcella frigidaquae]NHN44265.1 hypothetical protein [Microcella frigidaquae]
MTHPSPPAPSASAGAAIDAAAAALARQAATVQGLIRSLDQIVAALRAARVAGAWWGPAREALHVALDLERQRLEREGWRLESVEIQLRHEQRLLEESVPVGFLP